MMVETLTSSWAASSSSVRLATATWFSSRNSYTRRCLRLSRMAVAGSSITGVSDMLQLRILRTRWFSRSVDVLTSVEIQRLEGDPIRKRRSEEHDHSDTVGEPAQTG